MFSKTRHWQDTLHVASGRPCHHGRPGTPLGSLTIGRIGEASCLSGRSLGIVDPVNHFPTPIEAEDALLPSIGLESWLDIVSIGATWQYIVCLYQEEEFSTPILATFRGHSRTRRQAK